MLAQGLTAALRKNAWYDLVQIQRPLWAESENRILIGYRVSIKPIDTQPLRSFLDRYASPNRSVLAIV